MPLRNRNRNTIPAYRVGGGQAPFEFGNALEFDGVNDYVTCDFAGETAIKSTQPFTYAFWVKLPNGIGFVTPRIASLSTNSSFSEVIGFSNDVNYGNFFTITRNEAGKKIEYTFLSNTWYHIAVSYNGNGFSNVSNFKIYVDGVSQIVLSTPNISDTNNNDIVLGGSNSGNYNGEKIIDQFLFYDNYQASDAEISALYNSGDGQFPTTAITGDSPKVVWELDESGTATTATDSSGNGNDGALNGFSSPPDYWVAH